MEKTKKEIEEKISELTKKVLNEKILIEIKKERRNKLKNKIIKQVKNNESLQEEYEYIRDDEQIGRLVENNFSKDFLMELPKTGDVVLAMGINPGGGTKIINRQPKTKDSILFTILPKDKENDLDIFNDEYIFTHNYHKANYELFEKIGARAHWAMEGYLRDEEIKNMLKNIETKSKYDTEEIIETIRFMQKNEREKTKEIYVLFGDLFWYADGIQRNIEKALNEKELNDNIKEIIKLNIEYYKPRIIVVTNAKASHLIEEALKDDDGTKYNDECKDMIYFNNTPIIFASMVSGQRTMDTFSQERLKYKIQQVYNEVKRR